ncbi:MAG: metallophosphoesterase family protein [Deltaproteobacteria bacterium]|nr:metallophosphoesterase family protein [Deltaproteobacteria bacterium]
MIRRFGAIGDVHAEHEHLAAALDHLEREGCDAIFAVGDVVDGPGDVDRCCALLRERAICVRGNHDRWLLEGRVRTVPDAHHRGDLSAESLAWLESLPAVRTFETTAGRLLLCHAIGEDDLSRLMPEDEPPALVGNDALQKVLAGDFEIMVCGHTHRAMVRTIFGLLVVNAGTLHRADDPGFFHVDLEAKSARRFGIEGGEVREVERIAFGAPGDDVWGAGW